MQRLGSPVAQRWSRLPPHPACPAAAASGCASTHLGEDMQVVVAIYTQAPHGGFDVSSREAAPPALEVLPWAPQHGSSGGGDGCIHRRHLPGPAADELRVKSDIPLLLGCCRPAGTACRAAWACRAWARLPPLPPRAASGPVAAAE